MAIFDLPLEELRVYHPALTRQPDFDGFWARTLEEAARIPLEPRLEPRSDLPLPGVQAYQVTYASWDNARIAGFYFVPQGAGPFPAMVIYHGYSGAIHRMNYDVLIWPLLGYVTLAVDVRGQGGYSTDSSVYPEGHAWGWMTQGILDPERYYYRGVFVDCVRALDFVGSRPEADAKRIGLTGISQGGGLSLAVAGLDARPSAVFSEVPFLSHYQRATRITDQLPYREINDYCRYHPPQVEEQVFRTLSYFDVMNLADHIRCPTYVTVGLQDMICPPSTVFAAYNYLTCPREIYVSTFGQHEHFPGTAEEAIRWMDRHLGG